MSEENKELELKGQETPKEETKKTFGEKVKEAAGKAGKGVKKVVGSTWKFVAGAGVALIVKSFLDNRSDSCDYEDDLAPEHDDSNDVE